MLEYPISILGDFIIPNADNPVPEDGQIGVAHPIRRVFGVLTAIDLNISLRSRHTKSA